MWKVQTLMHVSWKPRVLTIYTGNPEILVGKLHHWIFTKQISTQMDRVHVCGKHPLTSTYQGLVQPCFLNVNLRQFQAFWVKTHINKSLPKEKRPKCIVHAPFKWPAHYLNEYINNSLHLAWIFVRGHYLFREVNIFQEWSSRKIMSSEELMMSKGKYPSIFGDYCVYDPSNIFCSACLGNIDTRYSPVLAVEHSVLWCIILDWSRASENLWWPVSIGVGIV